jgi:predicted O-linked N-acetylglucosamine transferase (SPINDLY family)
MDAPQASLIEQAQAAIAAGRLADAERLAQEAAAADETGSDGLLAQIFLHAGNLSEAEEYARKALGHRPDDAVTTAYLGAIMMAMGRPELALTAYRDAVSLQPDNAVLQNELGNALAVVGAHEDAAAVLRHAVGLRADIPEIQNNLGNVLRELGDLDAAAAWYRKALLLRAEYPEALNNLGVVLQEQRDTDGAIDAFRQALALQPANALANTHLGTALAAKGELTAAAAAHREALRHDPRLASARNNLGIVLKDQGEFVAAREAYAGAVAADGDDSSFHSNLLMSLSYDPAVDGETLVAEHRRWANRHERPEPLPKDIDWQPDRRIRIGYVSPDFWTHSVAYFIEPILECHDRDRFEIFCYADVARPDDTTDRLRRAAEYWCDSVAFGDRELFERIRADRIDILVDLSGHTGGNRLPVFGRRAAPVQISWIGYPATTGLSQMDYRISDGWADPEGETDNFHSERLLRLPTGFLCYRPPENAPAPTDRSGRRPITFGSFNNLSKVTDDVIALWARLLTECPDTRLLLKSRQLADDGVRSRVLGLFQANGVMPERLDLRTRVRDAAEHLALYGEVDVALDTFPYNGTTTTCEALWMGVPVIALAGSLHAGRVGVSLLNQIGQPGWVMDTPDAYVAKALAIAADRPRRAVLRDQVAGSTLVDAKGFTQAFEAALTTVWSDRCKARM